MLSRIYRLSLAATPVRLLGICAVASLVNSTAWASDLAVQQLLQGPQPVNRSQIISTEQIARVKKSTALAQAIVAKNAQAMATIAAGDFLSGDAKVKVYLKKAYKIDITEVSNRQYEKFVRALDKSGNAKKFAHPAEPETNSYQPKYWQEYRPAYFLKSPAAKVAAFNGETFKQAENPVVGVDWWDAYAYCQWNNKRLPTALEWEKSARGVDGRLWPWGNDWDYAKANSGGDKWGEVDGFIYAAPVISFGNGVSPYGLLNMAGNVAEWSAESILMGGSSNNRPSGVRASARQARTKNYRSFNIGFRCASNV